jgi:hypothetical protein
VTLALCAIAGWMLDTETIAVVSKMPAVKADTLITLSIRSRRVAGHAIACIDMGRSIMGHGSVRGANELLVNFAGSRAYTPTPP